MSAPNKRSSIFKQGKPESPYDERDEGPVDVPKAATAAQMATRKIRTLKPMKRPQGFTSGIPQEANFGAMFAGDSSQSNNSNSGGFGTQQQSQSGFSFGTGATNSFPPTQSSAPNNAFTNSSFPAFGSGDTNQGGFNPPATGFSFSTGVNNPFGQSAPSPSVNGGFSGSIFNTQSTQSTQPQETPGLFGSLAQNNMNNTTSQAPAGLFGTSAPQQSNGFPAFGTSAQTADNAQATASKPNIFGAFGSTAQSNETASTTAPSNPFGFSATTQEAAASSASQPFTGFGVTAQANGTAATTAPSLFSNSGTSAQNVKASQTPTANIFSLGSSTQNTDNVTAAAPTFGGFRGFSASAHNDGTATTSAPPSFGSIGQATQNTAAPASSAPATNIFGNIGTTTQSDISSTSTATPFSFLGAASKPQVTNNVSAPDTQSTLFGSTGTGASNPFAKLPTATPSTGNTPFSFGTTSQETPSTSAPKNNLFSSINSTAQNENKTSEPPKNPFIGLGANPQKQSEEPQAIKISKSVESEPKTSGFSTSLSGFKPNASDETAKELSNAAPKSTSLFSTQPGGLFTKPFTPPPTTSDAIGESILSANWQNTTKKNSLASAAPLSSTPKDTSVGKADDANKGQSNLFARAASPTKENQTSKPHSFFNTSTSPPKAQAPPSPASSMPTLTGAAPLPSDALKAPELPKIPKAHVPQNWSTATAESVSPALGLDESGKIIVNLSAQLAALNEQFRQKMASLPPMADWSALSLWHHKESTEIMKMIVTAKKQRAQAKGITGDESTLSTKRKANDEESRDGPNSSPTKRVRAIEPTTPTPKAPTTVSTTPKINPPASQTSNLFGSILNKGSPSASSSSNVSAPKTSDKNESELSKTDTSKFGFKPSFGVSTDGNGSKSTSSSGFNFTPSGSSSSSSSGFKVQSVGGTGGGGLLSQFAKSAETYEELAAKRKAKAKLEDYDSDEETEEAWSARYDKKEAERLAEEKKKAESAPSFSFGGSKTPSGTSSPGLFGSRVGSPVPSTTGGQSVFDAPPAAQTPSANIFAHLSSGPSSNNQDDDDDDDNEQAEEQSMPDQPAASTRLSPPSKRKVAESESESDETLEETMRRKKQDSRPSLLSRMSKADDSSAEKGESEKENNEPNKAASFGQTNGVQTPKAAPFRYFDFASAGAQSAPPKSDTFAGDQTFKHGTPIKFSAPETEKKDPPTFSFQPATPSAAEISATPSKPPLFSSIFSQPNSGSTTPSWLAPNVNQSGTSSVFSSRAPTPLSETETSGKDSAAENEEEEGSKQEQLDLSALTEDEKSENDIIFHAEQALAKHQIDKGTGKKEWDNLARGPLWILKNKETGKAFVRMRLSSGATPVNYGLLPKLKTTVTGNSKKMVTAVYPGKTGKLSNIIYAVKTPEIAEELSKKYNESIPS